jgi:hypothetical protein
MGWWTCTWVGVVLNGMKTTVIAGSDPQSTVAMSSVVRRDPGSSPG